MGWGVLGDDEEVGVGGDHVSHIYDLDDHHLPLSVGEVVGDDLRVVDVGVPVYNGWLKAKVPKAPMAM